MSAAKGHIVPRGFEKRAKSERQAKIQVKTFSRPMETAVPKKAAMGRAAAETEFVDRLIGYDATLGPYSATYTYEWDNYGFPKKVTSSSGSFQTYDYVWLTPGKVWESKTVTFHDANGGSFVETDIKRSFHANGNVAVSTLNGRETMVYDEEGHLIRYENIISEDGLKDVSTWTYFPAADQWFTGHENPSSKVEYTILDENSIVRDEYYRFGDLESDWNKVQSRTMWFEDGDMTGESSVYYETRDGISEIVSADGSREEKVTTPEGTGIIHWRLEFDGRNMEWVAQSRSLYSANFYDPIAYRPDEIRTEEYQDFEDGVWKTSWKETWSWVTEKVVKKYCEDFKYGEDTYYNYYLVENNDGKLEIADNSIYYDEKTGNYGIYDYDDNYDYYSYYTPDGQLKERFRCKNDEYYDEWNMWNGSEWVKCSGTITVYEGSDDTIVITFDNQGRPASITEYEYGVFESREEYTYSTNGYSSKYYEFDTDAEKEYLFSEESFETDGKGTQTEIWFEYEVDGTISYGSKRVEDNVAGTYYYYNFDRDMSQWIEVSRGVNELEEILADGTCITIGRDFDDNGNIVNRHKNVRLTTDNRQLEENYEWNSELNMWIGVWKYETVRLDYPDFKVIYPEDPTIILDEYFFPVKDEENSYDPESQWWSYAWQWDYAENTGWINHNGEPEKKTLLDDKTMEVKGTDYNYTVKVNDNRQIVEKRSHSESEYEPVKDTWHTWAYDEKGRIVRDSELRSDGDIWTYNFRYGPIEVVSGVEDVIAGAGAATAVTVYNLQGMRVLENAAPEALRKLPKGIYIVNGRKVAVK